MFNLTPFSCPSLGVWWPGLFLIGLVYTVTCRKRVGAQYVSELEVIVMTVMIFLCFIFTSSSFSVPWGLYKIKLEQSPQVCLSLLVYVVRRQSPV